MRSGRDESIRVVKHMCMEAMLESLCITILISNYQNTMSFLLLLMFSLQQNWRRGQNRFCLEAREVGGEGEGRVRGQRWPKQCMHI
jgi:hypothetical protein